MSGIRPYPLLCVLFSLVLSACAPTPPAPVTTTAAPRDGRSAVARNERVRVQIDGTTGFHAEDGGDHGKRARNLSVGIDRVLRYQANWAIEPGDVLFAEPSPDAVATAQTRFGSQHIGQNVTLALPKLAGAPMSLAVATELESDWLLGGFTELQRERAKLSWSPGPAQVNVQWSGSATLFDDRVALVCNLQSSIRLPARESSRSSAAIRLSGRNCQLPEDGTAYGGTDAQAWGLTYAWNNRNLQSEAVFSVIDPRWTAHFDSDTRPAYELGFSHRRDLGALSAKGLVSLRQGQLIDGAPTPDLAGDSVVRRHTDWHANASLTWQLSEASLSANWARGIDPFWFTPDRRQVSDRIGLALNLSHWVESLLPAASPQLAMNWNWSEIRLLNADVTETHSLQLDLALLF